MTDPAPLAPADPEPAPRPTLLARGALAAIRAYQLIRSGRPPVCRFTPTCSSYALEAITVHGAVRGTGLALRRVSRCRPLGGFGFDPVPERRADRDGDHHAEDHVHV